MGRQLPLSEITSALTPYGRPDTRGQPHRFSDCVVNMSRLIMIVVFEKLFIPLQATFSCFTHITSTLSPIHTLLNSPWQVSVISMVEFGNGMGAQIMSIYTAISRKVVGKNVHVTIPQGNRGYVNTLFLTL